MNPIIEAVKQNLDLSRNIPLKIAFYNALKRPLFCDKFLLEAALMKKSFPLRLILAGHLFATLWDYCLKNTL